MHDRSTTTRNAARPPLIGALTLVAAVVLPTILFLVLTLHDKSHRRDTAWQSALLATSRGAEQALVAINSGLESLERLEDATAGVGWAQVQVRRVALQAELRRIEQGLPAAAGLLAVRPDGRLALSGGLDLPATADLSALYSVRRMKDGQRGPFFDTAPREAFGGTALILAGRGRAPEGRPQDGAFFAALRAEALFGTSRDAVGRLALLREDGAVLLRQGGAAEGAALPALVPEALAAPPGDSPRLGDPFGDGAPQLVVAQRLGAYPLVLVHTQPAAEPALSWLAASVVNLAIALAVALVLLLVALRALRSERNDAAALERLETNATELRAEIARREAAEEGLRNAQRLEGLGRLTGGVAHDFNNLLTAILGTARSLERHLGPRADERTKRLIAATVAAVDRGARLNASLLAFARRQPLSLATVDTNALLRNFLPLLRRALDETMSVELTLDQELPNCRVDPAQLEAALLNLAINARDAMPKGGTLRIVTRRAWLQEQALAGNPEAQPGPYVAIEVRDSGQGMPPEVRERAFEPFFTTKAPGQGTGLGLSQVFGFVRQIGGHVAIQSTEGKGTTIALYLPLGSAIDQPAVSPAAAPPMPAHSGAGCAVLVVEDEPAVRAVAVDMLQDAGFAVLAAPDGPTALALLREGAHADVLFSDVVMPGGLTGIDLAREARRLRPGIGVLLASGYASEVLAQHGGADEFEIIGKPYDSDTVLARLVAQWNRQAASAA